MLLKSIIIFSIYLATSSLVLAEETCSRVAIINYQEVLVDTNSTEKGEGLRYHLNRDPIAKNFLDAYQEGSKIKWQNAVLGTIGTTLILSSFLTNTDRTNKKSLIIGGVSILLINFLAARTQEHTNESNLLRAIEEYNQRNLPKIYFHQAQNNVKTIILAKDWSF